MALSQRASERNQDARSVLSKFYELYLPLRRLTFYVEGETQLEEFGLTRARYREATEILTEKGLLKRVGLGTHQLDRAGVEASEDSEILDARLPVLRDAPVVAEPAVASSLPHVGAALKEANAAIEAGRPGAAIDRLHTALHARVRELCADHQVPLDEKASLPQAYSALCKAQRGGQEPRDEIERILRTLTSVLDSLSTLRNHASLAHPTVLLGNDDALLAINATRTVAAYIEAKFPPPARPSRVEE